MSPNIYSGTIILPLMPRKVDLHHLVAVFDCDDTLWPQFSIAARAVGLDPDKLDTFSVKNCANYTDPERAKLFTAFADAELFEQTQFYPGVEKIAVLHEMGVKIRINSKSFSHDIADIKRRRLKEILPFLQESDLNLTVSGEDHATTGKTVSGEVTFFTDDSPYNIITSDAAYNILPSQTWNVSLKEQYRMRGKNFYVWRC